MKTKKPCIYPTLILLLFYEISFGADFSTTCSEKCIQVSFESAVKFVLLNDPQLQIALTDTGVQKANVSSNFSTFLPTLDATYSDYSGSSRVNYKGLGSGQGNRTTRSSGISLSWLIWDFGQRSAALRSSKHLLNSAELVELQRTLETMTSAARLYYSALSTQQRYKSALNMLDIAQKNYKMAFEKYNSGVTTLADKLQAEAVKTQYEISAQTGKSKYIIAKQNLAIRMGLSPDVDLRLTENLENYDRINFEQKKISELLSDVTKGNPAILAMDEQVRSKDSGIDEAKALYSPTVSVAGAVEKDTIHQPGYIGSSYDLTNNSIGFKINIPIFNGFERGNSISRANYDRERSVASRNEVVMQAKSDAITNYRTLEMEHANIEKSKELLGQASQYFEVANGRYNSGVGTMIEILNAMTIYSDAQSSHIDSLINYRMSEIKLAADLGVLLL